MLVVGRRYRSSSVVFASSLAFLAASAAIFATKVVVKAFSVPAFRAAAGRHHRSITNTYNRCRMSSNSGQQQEGLEDIGKAETSNICNDPSTGWQDRIQDSIARCRKIRGSNYVQLATVDPITLEPRCRTIVFRGFYSDTDSMKMITDQRSNKVLETSSSSKNTAELVWWFPKSSEQYRIRGNLEFVGSSAIADKAKSIERKQMWGNLSDPAREQFYWDSPGLVPLLSNNKAVPPPGGRDAHGKVLEPPDTFLLMLLHPSRVDYLRLGDNYRQVDCLDGESDSWTQQQVTP